jgi:hypothetical protein
MTTWKLKLTAATVAIATLGVLMTQPTPNDLNLDLPMAIQGVTEPPVVMRIGVVVDLIEADNITVKISGSPVLVTASYLWPQYQPVLGDRVVVYRQDSQWFVVGTMSGPLNTLVPNPSFEEGTLGGLPTNWTLSVVSSAGGPPTFTKQQNINSIVSGNFIADFGVDATGTGVSEANVLSALIPAVEGSRWAAAYTLVGVNFFGGVDAHLAFGYQFLDSAGTMIVEYGIDNLYVTSGFYGPILRRNNLYPTNYQTAPPGTAYVRFKFNGIFNMANAASFISFYIDATMLRNVT